MRGALLIGMMCATGLVASPGASAAVAPPVTFASTGAEQSYVVPSGVSGLQITATGAPGGTGLSGNAGGIGGPGAHGAQVTGVVPVTPGETLYVEVGGAGGAGNEAGAGNGGFNGGGLGLAGGGGGGASDIRTVSCAPTCPGSSTSLQSRLLIAAGGGGGGGGFGPFPGGAGGDGGLVGSDGKSGVANTICTGGGPGVGATPTAGGTGGAAGTGTGCDFAFQGGNPGVFGAGGASGQGSDSGGGGGAGYYGGGGAGPGNASGGGGGGGGSSFGPAGATFAQDKTGVASVTVTPLGAPVAQVAPGSLSFPTQAMSTVSAPQTVTVTNAGPGALPVTGLSFAGGNPGDFFIGSSTCGGSVAVGASCQVTVFFVPQGQGARTATLDVTTTDPARPATVSLSGTGGPLAAGPAGPAGPTGATGATGATGPQGPPGMVVCRRETVAMALCTIIFAPGTFTVASAAKTARYTIELGRRQVATGQATIRHGVVTLVRLRALRPGRYELLLTTGSGRHRHMLLKRTIRVQ